MSLTQQSDGPAAMGWWIQIVEEIEPGNSDLPLEVRRAILAYSLLLRQYGL